MQAVIWLGDYHYGAGPGASGFLNDSIPEHLCHFSLASLVTDLQHTIGPLPDDGPWQGAGCYDIE